MIALTRWLSSTVTVHGSVGHGFRIPTYLDLYYSDPTTIGNPNLKPESAWNFEGGVNWFPKPRLALTVTAFYSRQHDTIDYTRAAEADPWMASNLPGVRFTGIETSFAWQPTATANVTMSWTLLAGAQNALHGLQSKYVFNYPVNNARITWTQHLSRQIALNTRLGVVQRFQQSPYAVWDTSLSRQIGWFRPYLQMTNLTNTGYQEIVDVRMPGRGFAGGVEMVFPPSRR
jgi:iron complex outermembrane receptor protein